MDEQIQINLLADDIVGEVIGKAIRYLSFKEAEEPEVEKYRQALEHIRAREERTVQNNQQQVSMAHSPPSPTWKSVTFTTPSKALDSEYVSTTPASGSSRSRLHATPEEDEYEEREIEVTRL